MKSNNFKPVDSPRCVKPGDILVWTKEKGKIPKLHLSAGSMRALGFSIGNRWRALSYSQVDSLTRTPSITRFYLVDSVEKFEGDRFSLSLDGEPRIREAWLTEFTPVPASTAEEFASLDKEGQNIINGLASSSFLTTRTQPMPAKFTFASGAVEKDMILRQFLDGTTDQFDTGAIRFPESECILRRADHVDPDSVISPGEFMKLARNVTEPGSYMDSERFYLRFPVRALMESVKRGAVLLRPTEDYWTWWSTKYAGLIKDLMIREYARMASALDDVSRTVAFGRKSFNERTRLLKSSLTKDIRATARKTKGVEDGLEQYK